VLRAQQELLVARGWSTSGAAEPKPVHGDGLTAGLEANARRRLELLGISAQDIDDVLRTGKAAEALPMRSPVDGYVVAKNAVAGVAVQPGMVLFEVADLSQVWVNAEIYEPDIARIHVGQKARLELASLPGETTTGKVSVHISPCLDRPRERRSCSSSSRTAPIATARGCGPDVRQPCSSTCRRRPADVPAEAGCPTTGDAAYVS
jgi:Cu(I)/Ag(I) efflux system membrane fusion protein